MKIRSKRTLNLQSAVTSDLSTARSGNEHSCSELFMVLQKNLARRDFRFVMGNTDSHSSFVSPAKPSCSLRFSSRREEVPSARSWWRSSSNSSQGGCRSRGRNYLNQHCSAPPYTSWHYEHAPKAGRGGSRLGAGSPQRFSRSQFGGSNGVCGERTSLESSGGGSPKVLLSKDGSMRVEFTNSRVLPVEPQGLTGLPTIATTTAPALAPIPDPSLRTSKGSSLSSDGSWYDSPWGGGAELADNVFVCGQSVDNSSGYTTYSSTRTEGTATSSSGYNTVFSAQVEDISPGFTSTLLFPATETNEFASTAGYNTCSSGRTEDSGIGDSVILQPDLRDFSLVSSSAASLDSVYTSHHTLPAFPTTPDPPLQQHHHHRAASSSSALLDDVIQEEEVAGGGVEQHFSSLTLPCRRAEAVSTAPATGNNRKDFLKSRIRRLSDWTGSLSRKKRRIQEPYGSDAGDVFINGLNSGLFGCSTLWSSNPLHSLNQNQNQFPPVHRGSSSSCRSLTQSSSDDGKLELVARRKWKHYWVTLKGCSLLFYETYGRSGGADQELSPRYALLADDSIVQAVPEHPRKEHVFCLSNSYGDVYLFQATNQTDLENWVTAIHSASASLLAKRQGKEDTLRLLRCQSRSLLHKIDMDGKMKKMAELQLSVIKEQKNRKAVERGSGRRRGHPSSLKALDGLNRRSRDTSHPTSQVFRSQVAATSAHHSERLECVSKQREVAPPAGRAAAVQVCDELQVQVLGVFSLHICRPDAVKDFGFAVTGHVDGAGKSHIYVSEVDPLGLSAREGLRAGDEVLAVNGAAVSGLDLDLMQSLFSHQKLQLLLRRDESPEPEEPITAAAAITAVWTEPGEPAEPCQPPQPPRPPHVHTWTTDLPSKDLVLPPADGGETMGQNMEQVYSLYQTFPEGQATDADVPKNPYCREVGPPPASPAHLSDLVCLFDIYLTPLQTETFLSKEEMEALFGSLPEMLDFQRVFLQTLEERIASCPNFSSLETPEQFKKLLFSLGASFLYYADHFKLYSGFCANHIKVQKVLERVLEARNPTNQHSSSLESYLIKPVQRVLKYPLLLRELVSLTDPESPEHTHLTEALRAMEKVASHINEMQKIYEDYGCVTDISMGEFLAHSSVVWLNPLPCLGRLRKEPELTLFVFKRAVILVYRENSKLKKRMTGSRSNDLDPFRFRWLIPVSAVQVRPSSITGSENPCVWELVHSRSEVEGRPETVFQLCSSGLETKGSVLRALRSLLRDRAPVGSLRRSRLSTAERSSSWRRRQQQRSRADAHRTSHHQSEESCRPDGRFLLGDTCSEPLLPSRAASDSAGKRTRLCSLTSDLEAQLQRLNFTEEESTERGATSCMSDGTRTTTESRTSSLRRSPGELLDLSGLLERDFSVQSMTSMINEECFYDTMLGIQKAAVPSLQG
ncbi:hypothetical protein INR49_002786 [Caranx melampygus]|nr:hypothetical protein INR49_002786 [Caranx melampygus]